MMKLIISRLIRLAAIQFLPKFLLRFNNTISYRILYWFIKSRIFSLLRSSAYNCRQQPPVHGKYQCLQLNFLPLLKCRIHSAYYTDTRTESLVYIIMWIFSKLRKLNMTLFENTHSYALHSELHFCMHDNKFTSKCWQNLISFIKYTKINNIPIMLFLTSWFH